MDPNNKIDFFSFLPDALILIIISHLPFVDAVRTSSISERWYNLWHSTTNIALDENLFIKNREEVYPGEYKTRFLNFIQHWIQNFHEPIIKEFRLVFSNPHQEIAQNCVQFVINKQELKSLHLDFSDPNWDEESLDEATMPQNSIRLPFFNAHEILETLHLSAVIFRVQEFNSFSCLKDVFLGWIELPPNSNSLNKFISGCPLLEFLVLKRCWNVGILNIDLKRLSALIIDKCLGVDIIAVDAPELEYFKYCGISVYLRMEYEYTRSMEEAILDFGTQTEYFIEDDDMLYNLLIEFWSVKLLTVCSYVLQVISMAQESVLKPKLSNLTQLILKTQLHSNEYYGITFFLKSCTKLEVLVIDLGTKNIFEDYVPPFSIEEHPFVRNFWCCKCVGKTLKRVNVIGYKGSPDEQTVLKYLLKYGRRLEYLVVGFSKERGVDDVDMEPTYRQNFDILMESPISSKNLQVFICQDEEEDEDEYEDEDEDEDD